MRVLIVFILIVSAHSVSAQRVPAAERGRVHLEIEEVNKRAESKVERKQRRAFGKIDRFVKKKMAKQFRGRSFAQDFWGLFLFWLGVACVLFGSICVIWFSTMGWWIFAIAVGFQIVGVTLGAVGLGIYTDWDGIATAIGMGIPMIISWFAWAVWIIVGIFIWLL